MISANNLRKVVLLFSTVLVGLLLWLSISFLLVANTERQNARLLSNYIETDKVLRQASIALAEERSATYWLTGIDGLFFAAQWLEKPRTKTDQSLMAAVFSLQSTIEDWQYVSLLRFQPSHLQTLLEELQVNIRALADMREAIAGDLKFPSARRDKALQLSTLEHYRQLIEDLELLRHGVGYTASNTSRDTLNILAVSDAAWNIGLSNKLLSAIYEGYITSGNTLRDDAHLQVAALSNRIDENLQTIRRIDAYANIDEQLHAHAEALSDWYTQQYVVPARQISQAIANDQSSSYTTYDWRKAATALDEHAQRMLDRADEISRENVLLSEQRAFRNLLIDATLVILCVLLMFGAYWIVRRMHQQSIHDALTGLPNRRLFKLKCEERLDNSNSNTASLLKIDLNKFKTINDNFGQVVGDKLLQSVANRIKKQAGTSTLAARLGGDEYAVLLHDADNSKAAHLAGTLARELSGDYRIDGHRVPLTVCVGYACQPEHAQGSEELRKAADLALYEAKQTGPGTVMAYQPSIAKAFQERQQMETELSNALERKEFELHYQPQFDLENSVVEGVEALIRWRHPTRGMVSPFHFIPVAEDAGLLPAIGQWVIEEAVRQAASWREDYGLHLRMSVNVSAHQFLHGNLVDTIEQALTRENLSPSAFEIEITESVAMAEMDLVIGKLNALHDLGIRIALDDFGTGYSSLSYLQDLPLDTLKIDRSFITKIDSGTRTQRLLLESIASMAKLLDFHTVAEGVETDRQLDEVRALGIDTVQGYYYSKPVSAEQLPADVQAIDAEYGSDTRDAA